MSEEESTEEFVVRVEVPTPEELERERNLPDPPSWRPLTDKEREAAQRYCNQEGEEILAFRNYLGVIQYASPKDFWLYAGPGMIRLKPQQIDYDI